MIEIVNKSDCCGCTACYCSCPVRCIEMIEDEEGCFYPKVNKELCIGCNRCVVVCPVKNSARVEGSLQFAYAAKNKSNFIRKMSSSGGVFTSLATYVLKEGGVVYGATYDSSFNVEHIRICAINEIYRLQGSKYVQSVLYDTYIYVKKDLLDKKKVLFSGTSCQINGLKNYLGKKYDNLICVAIACHGVAIPKVWKYYLEFLNKKYGNIMEISQRNKKYGWKNYSVKITTVKKQAYIHHLDDVFFRCYMDNLCLRESCYKCCAKLDNTKCDIMLADFWGINKILPQKNDDKGISLVLVRNIMGVEILEQIKEEISLEEVDYEFAINENKALLYCSKYNEERMEFLDKLKTNNISTIVKRFCYEGHIRECRNKLFRFKSIILNAIKRRG